MSFNFRRVHFIGICGTAVGNVAVAMQQQGYQVTGSDANAYPPMSDLIRANGIQFHVGYHPDNVPQDVDLVVVGNAISRGNVELEATLNRHLVYWSLPETLRHLFLRGRKNLVVAGTHGKTTTASMLTHILRVAGQNPAWMIGGVALDLDAGCSLHPSETMVLEGDEYDTCFFDKGPKFAHYLPSMSLLNDVDEDQKDIYPNIDAVKVAFDRLLRVTPQNGTLIYNADRPACVEVALTSKTTKKISIGLTEGAQVRATELEYNEQGSSFLMHGRRLRIPLFGEIYVRNALAAAQMALEHGVSLDMVETGLATFRGVKKRQELKGEAGGVLVYDDFGKHPENILGTLQGFVARYPTRRVWAAVDLKASTMCHLDIHSRLVDALSIAYGSVLSPIERVDRFKDKTLKPSAVAAEVVQRGKASMAASTMPEIVELLLPLLRPGDVVIGFSSGDFGGFHATLLERLKAAK